MGMGVVSDFLFQLQNHTKALPHEPNAKLFRGHRDEAWELVPSIARSSKLGINDQASLEKWVRMASPFVVARPQTPTEWLVLAQHHGVPTPLLDWTYNPLVALFFACDEKAGSTATGCVWMLTTDDTDNFTTNLLADPFRLNRTRLAVVPSSGYSARANSQFSAMTLSSNHAEAQQPDIPATIIFHVADEDKASTRRALNILGWSPRNVFASLDRAAKDFSLPEG